MTAFGVHALFDSELILKTADLAGALTLEALEGIPHSLDERVHALRPHPGQVAVARNLRRVLEGSGLVYRKETNKVQDAYSLRCIPRCTAHRVMPTTMLKMCSVPRSTPLRTTPFYSRRMIPLFQPVTFTASLWPWLWIFWALPWRKWRIFRSGASRGLLIRSSAVCLLFLSASSGLNSGYMIIQYTAAALVSENKVLAHPPPRWILYPPPLIRKTM